MNLIHEWSVHEWCNFHNLSNMRNACNYLLYGYKNFPPLFSCCFISHETLDTTLKSIIVIYNKVQFLHISWTLLFSLVRLLCLSPERSIVFDLQQMNRWSEHDKRFKWYTAICVYSWILLMCLGVSEDRDSVMSSQHSIDTRANCYLSAKSIRIYLCMWSLSKD